MSDKWSPALTPEQWEARDYRQAAREAAFALAEQPFGFSPADVDALNRAAAGTKDEDLAAELRGLGDRLQALLPPTAA